MNELAIQSVVSQEFNVEWGMKDKIHPAENVADKNMADTCVAQPFSRVAANKRASHRSVSAQDTAAITKTTSDAILRDNAPQILHDITHRDPILLALSVALTVLDTSARNANALSQQLTRATDLQVFLREKQVEQYQEQINKAIEQADVAHKAAMINVVFDWVICAMEAAYGAAKMAQGLVSANPLELADGAAFITAAAIGMVKVGAELLLILGRDNARCNAVIQTAGRAQSVCECVAMTLDFIQIGQRIVCASRALVPAVETALKAGVGQELQTAIITGSEGDICQLAQQLGEDVSKNLGNNFGMAMEREMVDVAEMANEAAQRALEGEKNMVRSMGPGFTPEGVARLIATTVEEGGMLLKQGEDVCMKKLSKTLLQRLRNNVVAAVINDASMKAILLTRGVAAGVTHMSAGAVGLKTSTLRKQIEELIVQQRFNDFLDNWTEDRKMIQQKQLGNCFQQGADALTYASEMIDSSGTVLARVASGCA